MPIDVGCGHRQRKERANVVTCPSEERSKALPAARWRGLRGRGEATTHRRVLHRRLARVAGLTLPRALDNRRCRQMRSHVSVVRVAAGAATQELLLHVVKSSPGTAWVQLADTFRPEWAALLHKRWTTVLFSGLGVGLVLLCVAAVLRLQCTGRSKCRRRKAKPAADASGEQTSASPPGVRP